MATLDEISKEKERVSEALARVDAQREKLAGQLGELEATERVLARYSKGVRARKTASVHDLQSPGATADRSCNRHRAFEAGRGRALRRLARCSMATCTGPPDG